MPGDSGSEVFGGSYQGRSNAIQDVQNSMTDLTNLLDRIVAVGHFSVPDPLLERAAAVFERYATFNAFLASETSTDSWAFKGNREAAQKALNQEIQREADSIAREADSISYQLNLLFNFAKQKNDVQPSPQRVFPQRKLKEPVGPGTWFPTQPNDPYDPEADDSLPARVARGGDNNAPTFGPGSSSYHGTGLGDGTASRDGGKKGFPGSSGYHGTGLADGTARGDGTRKGFPGSSGYHGTGLNDGTPSRKGKGTRDVSPSDGSSGSTQGSMSSGGQSIGQSSGGGGSGSLSGLPGTSDNDHEPAAPADDHGPRTYFIDSDAGTVVEVRDAQPDPGGEGSGGTADPEGGTDETPRMHGLSKASVSRGATLYRYGGSSSADADRGGNNPRFMGGPSEKPDPEAGGGGTPRSRDVFPSPEDTGSGNPRGLASRMSFGGARAVTRR